jgi:hypothetical protein
MAGVVLHQYVACSGVKIELGHRQYRRRELRLFTMRLWGRPVEKIVDDIMARLFASSVGLEGWPVSPHIVILGANPRAGKQPRRLSPPGPQAASDIA